MVISAKHGHAIVHQGPDGDKELVLLMHDGHFDVITKLPGFFNRNYFCKKCEKGFDHDDSAPLLLRPKCDQRFFGVTRQLNHMTKTSSGQDIDPQKKDAVCFTHHKCSSCGAVNRRGEKHECGQGKCPSCKKGSPPATTPMLPATDPKEKEKTKT